MDDLRRIAAEAEHEQGTRLPDLDINEIMEILPHRYPMLLLDRVVEVTAFERIVGIKNVTVNEPFFQGHFPGNAIMPGVFIIEAMAQTAAASAIVSFGRRGYGSAVYFMAIEEARFRRPVRPGDQLRLEMTLQKRRLGVWKYRGVASVEGDVAAEALLTAKLLVP